MRVLVAAHLEKLSGAHGDLVYVHKANGTCFARRRPCTRHRRDTEDQLQTRSFTAKASANWNSLTHTQREGWHEYAVRKMIKDRSGRLVTPNAVAMYVRANMTRQILGLPLLTDPPTADEPRSIHYVEPVHVADPRTVGVRVFHSYEVDTDLSDLVVLARMAPPPKTEARKFVPTDLRYICKLTSQSAQPLPHSGGSIFYSPTQFEVPPGKRYMIELRVARISDGIVSDLVEGTFLKAL